MQKFHWYMVKPVKSIQDFDENPLTKETLNQKIAIKKGDKVALFYNEEGPVYTEPINGSTLKDVLNAIERGLNKTIPNDDLEIRRIVYDKICYFFSGKNRLDLIKKYEKGILKSIDLIKGGRDFYEGNLKRLKNGIWIYGTGS